MMDWHFYNNKAQKPSSSVNNFQQHDISCHHHQVMAPRDDYIHEKHGIKSVLDFPLNFTI